MDISAVAVLETCPLNDHDDDDVGAVCNVNNAGCLVHCRDTQYYDYGHGAGSGSYK